MNNTNERPVRKDGITGSTRVRHALYKPLTFFFIIVAIIFVMSVFLKINRIEVTGNNLYSADEIVAASGIQEGDSLFFLNRIGAGSRIVVKLPYVDSVQISRSLPDLVIIEVGESMTIGYMNVNGEKWTVNYMGKFLNMINDETAKSLAPISGFTVETATTGDIVRVSDNDADKLSYLLDIMYQIQARGLAARVNAIDVSNVANPTFDIDGRFVVQLGENSDTEYKFGKLISAISQLKESDAGTLDLSEGSKVYFSPN